MGPEILNKHVNHLLRAFNISTSFLSLSGEIKNTAQNEIKKSKAPRGFYFEYTDKKSGRKISGNVKQEKRLTILSDFLTVQSQNKCKIQPNETDPYKVKYEDRPKYCSLAFLLTLPKIYRKNNKGKELDWNVIDLFKGKSFAEMVELFAENLTESFSESLYDPRVVSVFSKSGNLLTELKPWGCTVFYTDNGINYTVLKEDFPFANADVLKKDLSECITDEASNHPLVRLFLTDNNLDEHLSLLQSALKIKAVYIQISIDENGVYSYVPDSISIKAYISKIISGSFSRHRKLLSNIISSDASVIEKTIVDIENELSKFAFFTCTQKESGYFEKKRKLADLFIESGVLKKEGKKYLFSNSYLKWVFAALHLSRKYFNKNSIYIPEGDTTRNFSFLSLWENIFQCIDYFVQLDRKSSDDNQLLLKTVFATAIILFLDEGKRRIFILFLCELSKDYSCRFRSRQELAISILCTALNEFIDALDGQTRSMAFKCCYSKTNYKIQQESFMLLQPSSSYYINEIKRNYHAYIGENAVAVSGCCNFPARDKQPFYYFYYHHLFKDELNKTKNILNNDWDESWIGSSDSILGVSLAIRELSWQDHNGIQEFTHFENINYIIKKCISIIPLAEELDDSEEKRKYALAVESIAYTIANKHKQLCDFNNGKGDSEKASEKLARIIFGYDLFMRQSNEVYQNFLFDENKDIGKDNVDGFNIDGLLICGMLRAFSYEQAQIQSIAVDEEAWKTVLKNETGRFKVLIARTLAYTDFYRLEENKQLLIGIADGLLNKDFLPYDNIDVSLIYNNPDNPKNWYADSGRIPR